MRIMMRKTTMVTTITAVTIKITTTMYDYQAATAANVLITPYDTGK